MAVQEVSRTGIKMTKKNKLAIVRRAREIISDPKRWTKRRLRRKVQGEYRYCLLGACEQAVYDLGLAEPGEKAFAESKLPFYDCSTFGYQIGLDVSIQKYSLHKEGMSADNINDIGGHKAALELLDGYITELKKPRK